VPRDTQRTGPQGRRPGGRAPAAGGSPSAKAASQPAAADNQTDLLGVNAACYVCHMTFVKEELAKVHLAAKVTCVQCHGLSDKHANDENIGATKPDVLYRRSEIDASCVKCHPQHDAPARKVIARLLDRRLPSSSVAVCTDCHGLHRIAKEETE
jgi:hypothetical protein